MNRLTFRVAVIESDSHDFHSTVPGMMVCGCGDSLEKTLENTKSVIADYMTDSAAAINELGLPQPGSYLGASWHTLEIMR